MQKQSTSSITNSVKSSVSVSGFRCSSCRTYPTLSMIGYVLYVWPKLLTQIVALVMSAFCGSYIMIYELQYMISLVNTPTSSDRSTVCCCSSCCCSSSGAGLRCQSSWCWSLFRHSACLFRLAQGHFSYYNWRHWCVRGGNYSTQSTVSAPWLASRFTKQLQNCCLCAFSFLTSQPYDCNWFFQELEYIWH